MYRNKNQCHLKEYVHIYHISSVLKYIMVMKLTKHCLVQDFYLFLKYKTQLSKM